MLCDCIKALNIYIYIYIYIHTYIHTYIHVQISLHVRYVHISQPLNPGRSLAWNVARARRRPTQAAVRATLLDF